jgi:hypothetical protein
MQHAPAHGGSYALLRELAEFLLKLHPHEEAAQLLGSDRRRPRPAERIKDQPSFSRGGHKRPSDEPQGLLGRVVAVEFLALRDSWDAPDRGDLGGRI